MSVVTVHVFYAEQLMDTVEELSIYTMFNRFRGGVLPDGAYLLTIQPNNWKHWYRSDFTPVLPVDVPKPYKLLELLLT